MQLGYQLDVKHIRWGVPHPCPADPGWVSSAMRLGCSSSCGRSQAMDRDLAQLHPGAKSATAMGTLKVQANSNMFNLLLVVPA